MVKWESFMINAVMRPGISSCTKKPTNSVGGLEVEAPISTGRSMGMSPVGAWSDCDCKLDDAFQLCFDQFQ